VRLLASIALAVLQPHVALAQPTPEAMTQATELATQALELFNRGELVPAAEKFMQAYELSGRPAQLRNAAKAFESAGKLTNAIDAWQQYAHHPEVEIEKRAEAEKHVLELQARLQSELAPLAPTRPPAELIAPPVRLVENPNAAVVAPSEPARSTPVAGWIMIGGGAAAVFAGGVLLGTGWATYGDWKADNTSVTFDQASAAETRSAIGVTLGSVGLAVVAAAILFAFDP